MSLMPENMFFYLLIYFDFRAEELQQYLNSLEQPEKDEPEEEEEEEMMSEPSEHQSVNVSSDKNVLTFLIYVKYYFAIEYMTQLLTSLCVEDKFVNP